MSSFLNKARDKVEAVLDNSKQGNNSRSDNYGQHSSNAMDRVDPSADSDLDQRSNPQGRAGGFNHPQTSGQYGSTHDSSNFTTSQQYGSDTNTSGYDNPRSTNADPYAGDTMNKFDSGVGSDRDGRNDLSSYTESGRFGQQYDNAPTTTTAAGGAHRSNLANKLDSRYEGEENGRDRSAFTTSDYGNTQTDPRSTRTGVHDATTMGHGGTFDNSRSTNTGPHNSSVMNKLDPRYDNDRDYRDDPSSRVGGYGSSQTEDYGHTTGIGGGDTIGGTDDYNRSTGTGHRQPMSGATGGYDNQSGGTNTGYGDSSFTAGSGTARDTAGPHNSNILNKLDPRVDSDADGSKTYGGNQTYR